MSIINKHTAQIFMKTFDWVSSDTGYCSPWKSPYVLFSCDSIYFGTIYDLLE